MPLPRTSGLVEAFCHRVAASALCLAGSAEDRGALRAAARSRETTTLLWRGIAVLAGTRLAAVDRQNTRVMATVIDAAEQERPVTAERMLLGIGITPNTADLGLEELGVARIRAASSRSTT